MKKVCVIFNPTARGDRAKYLRTHLDLFGGECDLKPTPSAGSAPRLAAEAVLQGYSTIVAAGGDGTVFEVLNGIGSIPDGFERVRFGVLPLGTVNVFAVQHFIPLKLNKAWEIIQTAPEFLIDLPKATFDTPQGPVTRYFGQLAGAGIDSRSVELVSWKLKKVVPYIAYLVAIFKAALKPFPDLSLETDTETITAQQVVIGNGPFFGGPMVVFKNASMTDGKISVATVSRIAWKPILMTVWGAVIGRIPVYSADREIQTSKIRITSPVRVPFQLDGEIAGVLPVTISVEPRRLRVLSAFQQNSKRNPI